MVNITPELPKHHGVMDKSSDLFIIIMMPWEPGFESWRCGSRSYLNKFVFQSVVFEFGESDQQHECFVSLVVHDTDASN